MTDEDYNALGCLVGAVVLAICLPLLILLRAFALYELWTWFIAPLGPPSINMVHACGLSLTIGLFMPNHASGKSADKSVGALVKMIGADFVRRLVILGLGWICHCFM